MPFDRQPVTVSKTWPIFFFILWFYCLVFDQFQYFTEATIELPTLNTCFYDTQHVTVGQKIAKFVCFKVWFLFLLEFLIP